MFERLSIFAKANDLALHAAARQSVIAQNVANADTPGYRARDVASFAETYQRPARPDACNAQWAFRGKFGNISTRRIQCRLPRWCDVAQWELCLA